MHTCRTRYSHASTFSDIWAIVAAYVAAPCRQRASERALISTSIPFHYFVNHNLIKRSSGFVFSSDCLPNVEVRSDAAKETASTSSPTPHLRSTIDSHHKAEYTIPTSTARAESEATKLERS